jgi:hypothetical protein
MDYILNVSFRKSERRNKSLMALHILMVRSCAMSIWIFVITIVRKVLAYLEEKFRGKTSKILTFNSLSAKLCIKEVGKIAG